MRQKCEYCESWIQNTDAVCPNCGAPNAHMSAEAGDKTDGAPANKPTTIEELRAFCERHNLPLEQMRFFIGEDYRKPKAFGIYQDGSDFVVYKNKADGSRAVRYRGPDEAHAVDELYQKMKSEIALRKRPAASAHASKGAGTTSGSGGQISQKELSPGKKRGIIAAVAAVVLGLLVAAGIGIHSLLSAPMMGYYKYNDTLYYYADETWYRYDTDVRDWRLETNPPAGLTEGGNDNWESYSYHTDYDASDFGTSEYGRGTSTTYSGTYDDNDDDDSGWFWDWDDDDDDDWDWDDDDSWDSDLTDWDDDW